ncbi:transcriptional regulator with XRE-family HTH domain [Nocardia sp. GAS34]|uniref:helix-turn-helix domain-containing protein n=1 Tax=unclassified Nocardia TaxID=2637762 RepID=UPI003D1DD566
MAMAKCEVGALIRRRREGARYSQMALALEVGVSTRHLGFVELGRSGVSPELLLRIAERLDVPLHERNEWLLAAGYAPRYARTPLDDPGLGQVQATLQRLLDTQDPFPAIGLDAGWNIRMANRAAARLSEGLPPHVTDPTSNLFRIALHPDGFAGSSDNFAAWSPYLLRNLDLVLRRTADPDLARLAEEIATWPRIPPRDHWAGPVLTADRSPVLAWHVRVHGQDLSLFSIMTTLGTPLDITLQELTIEMFFPADAATDRVLHQLAG